MRAPITFLTAIVSVILLTACATPDHAEMQTTFAAGLKDYDGGNYKAAYDTWHKIDEYDLAAMRNVALMLRKGEGIEKNPKAAQKKMQQAAELGLVTAQADLGEMLLNGEAGPPDPAAAIPWLARAAAAGHPLAALELGKIYDEGKLAPQDQENARQLYRVAAKAGLTEAAARLKALSPPPETAPDPGPPPALRH